MVRIDAMRCDAFWHVSCLSVWHNVHYLLTARFLWLTVRSAFIQNVKLIIYFLRFFASFYDYFYSLIFSNKISKLFLIRTQFTRKPRTLFSYIVFQFIDQYRRYSNNLTLISFQSLYNLWRIYLQSLVFPQFFEQF